MKKYILSAIATLFIFSASASTLDIGGYATSTNNYDGGSVREFPILLYYQNSASQIIYLSSELSETNKGILNSLSLRAYNESFDAINSKVKIYLNEISQSEFEYDTTEKGYKWIDYTTGTLVYSGTLSMELVDYAYDEPEFYFQFTKKYQYKGGNLVVTFIVDGDSSIESYDYISTIIALA